MFARPLSSGRLGTGGKNWGLSVQQESMQLPYND